MKKNKKYIVKGAGVLLVAAVLLFTSVAVTANTVEEEKVDPRFFRASSSDVVYGNDGQSAIDDDVLFSQLPYEPYETWIFMTSDASAGYRVHDNYWNVTESICDVHWWGLSLTYTGSGWQNCNPEDMCFNIVFWDELLGQQICSYEACPPALSTGKFYSGFEMFSWQTVLDPCCDQYPDGWVSIQSYSSPNGCWLLWAGSDDGDHYSYQQGSPDPEDFINDTAFELTKAGPPPVAAICCSAVSMEFGDVDPGQNVTGQIKVCNCGDELSFLNWHVDTASAPTWATWKFMPESGTDLLEPKCAVVDVEGKITEDEGEYTGTIRIYNSDNASDFCEITTSANVIVPRARTAQNPFLLNLLQQFPALYLILKIIFRA